MAAGRAKGFAERALDYRLAVHDAIALGNAARAALLPAFSKRSRP